MKLQHANLTKRKQVIMAVGTAATLIGLLVFGLWVSDPNKDKPSILEQQREKAREVTKDFRTKNVVSDKENWMAKSEETLAEQSQQIRDMSSSMRTIQKRLTALGIDVQHGRTLLSRGARRSSARAGRGQPTGPVQAPGARHGQPPDSGGTGPAVARPVPGTTRQPRLAILPARAGRHHPGR